MLSVAIVHSGGAYARRVQEYLASRPDAQVTAFAVPANLPAMMDEEEAAALIPAGVAQAEVVIGIHLHYALLLELPHIMGQGRGQALIIPREEPDWVRPGQIREITKGCARHGIESAFPKPFCAFEPRSPVLKQFADDYQVGRHQFHVRCQEGVVVGASCAVGSACGLTEWVVEELIGRPCDETLTRAAVELLHLRPCLASMALDDETGDTIMHKSIALMEHAGEAALESVEVVRE